MVQDGELLRGFRKLLLKRNNQACRKKPSRHNQAQPLLGLLVGFVLSGHFISIYSSKSPPFTRESARWSADPANIERYQKARCRLREWLRVGPVLLDIWGHGHNINAKHPAKCDSVLSKGILKQFLSIPSSLSTSTRSCFHPVSISTPRVPTPGGKPHAGRSGEGRGPGAAKTSRGGTESRSLWGRIDPFEKPSCSYSLSALAYRSCA